MRYGRVLGLLGVFGLTSLGGAEVFDLSANLIGLTTPTGAEGTITGTETIDTVEGVVTGVNLAVVTPYASFQLTTADITRQGLDPDCVNGGCNIYFLGVGHGAFGGDLSIDVYPNGSLAGFQGGYLCDTGSYGGDDGCNQGGNGAPIYEALFEDGQYVYNVDSGVLTPAAVQPGTATPEPGSLLLCGTGLLGMMAAARRRLL